MIGRRRSAAQVKSETKPLNEEHLTDEQVEQYLRRKSLSEAEQIDRHLATCDRCRTRVCDTLPLPDAYRALQMEFGGVTEPDHLTYPQAAAYVDGNLDEIEREMADLHLEICDRCTEVIAGLRAVEPLIAEFNAKSSEAKKPSDIPSPVVPGPATDITPAPPLPWWRAILRRQEPRQERPTANRVPLYWTFGMASGILLLSPVLWVVGSRQEARVHDLQRKLAALDRANRQHQNELLTQQNQRQWQVRQSARTAQMLQQARDQLNQLAKNQSSTPITNEDIAVVSKVKIPDVLKLPPKSQEMGSDTPEKSFRLRTPVLTYVHTPLPTLAWDSVPGAMKYIVLLKRVGGTQTGDKDVIELPVSPEHTTYTVPHPLAPAVTYLWSVEASLRDGTIKDSEQATFRILSDKEAAALYKSVDDVYQRAAKFKWPGARLHRNLGDAYKNAHLLDEAQQEYKFMPTDRTLQGRLNQLKKARQQQTDN
jgi:hypothetical protein